MQLKAKNLGFGYRKDEWIFRNKDFEINSNETLNQFKNKNRKIIK